MIQCLCAPFQVPKTGSPAKVAAHHHEPRSYVVEYSGKKYRRNRKDLHLSTYNAYGRANKELYCDPNLRQTPLSVPPTTQLPQNVAPPLRRQTHKKEDTIGIDAKSIPPPVPELTSEPQTQSPKRKKKESLQEGEMEQYTTRSGRVSKRPKRFDV